MYTVAQVELAIDTLLRIRGTFSKIEWDIIIMNLCKECGTEVVAQVLASRGVVD